MTEKNEPEWTAVQTVYEALHKLLKIKARTVQWYVTENLIPRPSRKGGEAFYDLRESQVIARVTAIVRMQEVLSLKLWQIREIVEKYKDEKDWERFVTLVENLGEAYPSEEEDYNGNWRINDENVAVHRAFTRALMSGKPFSQISVIDAEQEALTKPPKEDFDSIFAPEDEVPF